MMGLWDRLAKFRDSFVVDDPEPSYSALDVMDGLAPADYSPPGGKSLDRPESAPVRPNRKPLDTAG